MRIHRREMIGGLLAGAAASVPLLSSGRMASAERGHSTTEGGVKKLPTFRNADFYDGEGNFVVERGKKAFYRLMEHHGYPIPPRLRGEEFWCVDFGLGKFTEVGMAGIFWVNNHRDDYFGHEIYLLPGQMIPEHRHLRTPKARPKMEAWQPRHGHIHIYAEGDSTPGVEARIPPTHREIAKARKETRLMPGEVGELAGPEEWHWMRAGPEGAIVTEYASYHDNDALRFSHPDIQF